MNYIKKLQKENGELRKELLVLSEGIDQVQAYLRSNKFSENPMVNREDIFLRFNEIIFEILDLDNRELKECKFCKKEFVRHNDSMQEYCGPCDQGSSLIN